MNRAGTLHDRHARPGQGKGTLTGLALYHNYDNACGTVARAISGVVGSNAVLEIDRNGQHDAIVRRPGQTCCEHPSHIVEIKVAATRLDEVADITGVGIVEDFHASAELIAARIRQHFPRFDFGQDARNQTRPVDDWKDELQRLEAMLPKDLLARMVTLNASDFALYHRYRS